MPGWMNEQVKGAIENLQRKYGFQGREAIAFWHLMEAQQLMLELRSAERDADPERAEERYDALPPEESAGRQIKHSFIFSDEVYTEIVQHFVALYKELGRYVLQRTYPQGWGGVAEEAEES